jgi:hypothetical protein
VGIIPSEFNRAQLTRPSVDVAKNVTMECTEMSKVEVALDRHLASIELVHAKRRGKRLEAIERVLNLNPPDIPKDLGPGVNVRISQ